MIKRSILPFFLLALAASLVGSRTYAQSACDKALIEAENLYQSGQLYDISDKLIPCLENGFNEQEKQSAYRLLTLTYLNINKEEEAKNMLHKLLQLNPDYAVSSEKDPVELYNLYRQFNVNPVFYTGIRAGAMLSQPYILNQRTSSSLTGSDKFYSAAYGLALGLDFVAPLYKNLLVELSPAYANSSYWFRSYYLTDGFAGPAENAPVQEVNGREQFHHLVLPLMLNLRIPARRAKLFYTVGAGAGVSFLLTSAYKDVNRVNRQIFSEEINMARYDTSPYRRNLNLLAQLELGLEYKYLGYFWGARAGFSSMLLNYTQYASQSDMYLNSMSTTFGWLDDDFVLANGSFSLFIRKPIYKFL